MESITWGGGEREGDWRVGVPSGREAKDKGEGEISFDRKYSIFCALKETGASSYTNAVRIQTQTCACVCGKRMHTRSTWVKVCIS